MIRFDPCDTHDLGSALVTGEDLNVAASDAHQTSEQFNERGVRLTLIGRGRKVNSEDSSGDPIDRVAPGSRCDPYRKQDSVSLHGYF